MAEWLRLNDLTLDYNGHPLIFRNNMENPEDEWTVVEIESSKPLIDIFWPIYDRVWVEDGDGGHWLSRDQGESWHGVGAWAWYEVRLLYWVRRQVTGLLNWMKERTCILF